MRIFRLTTCLLLCLKQIRCKPPSLLSFDDNSNLIGSFDEKSKNYLLSKEFHIFISGNFNLQRGINSFFKSFEISPLTELEISNSKLKFLDFFYSENKTRFTASYLASKTGANLFLSRKELSEKLNIARTASRIGDDIQFPEKGDTEGAMKFFNLVSNIKMSKLDKIIPFIKYDVGSVNYELVSRKNIKFLLHFIYQVVEKGYLLGELKTNGLLDFPNLCFEAVCGINEETSMDNYGVFIYFLHHVSKLSSLFFKYDYDACPLACFNKMIFLVQSLKSYFYIDSGEMQLANKNIDQISNLFDHQHIQFMKIYRDQYNLIFTQNCFSQESIDENVRAEYFAITCAVFDTLHWIITLICNFSRLLHFDQPIKVYEINFKYIEMLKLSEKFSDLEEFNERCGIKEMSDFTVAKVIDQLTKSLINLLTLPVNFFNKDKRIGIGAWNKKYDLSIRFFRKRLNSMQASEAKKARLQ